MYLITVSGRNRAGVQRTEVLGQDRFKASTVSGFVVEEDGTVFEEAEFLDAKTKRYFARGLTSRVMRWTTFRQHGTPGGALNFARLHRKEVPAQGTVEVEVRSSFGAFKMMARNACVRIVRCLPLGVASWTDYEVLFGDFD